MIHVMAALLAAAVAPVPVAACDGTTRDVEACLASELARADADLNRYYRTAVARLTKEGQPDALRQLRRSETAWIAHRDAECGAVWEYWKQGSIRGTVSTECRIQLTKARTLAIWRNWLTYADSSPPLLPRPAEPE